MNKIRNIIFIVFGIIGMIVQLLGVYIILVLLDVITGAWVTLATLGIVITLVDVWKRKYFVKNGWKFNLSGFKKEENDNNQPSKSE